MGISADKIRNIALIGHSGEGKTTLAEAILLNMEQFFQTEYPHAFTSDNEWPPHPAANCEKSESGKGRKMFRSECGMAHIGGSWRRMEESNLRAGSPLPA